MKKKKFTSILGYQVFSDELHNIHLFPDNQCIINTINAHSYILAKKDRLFKEALENSNILIPDGSGIVLASKFLYNKNIQKIAGYDLHEHLLILLNQQNGRCFYMGSSPQTLYKIKEKLKREFPNIHAEFYSPPYKEKFTSEENNDIIKAINKFKPQVLFVGMTAPKQEKWVYMYHAKINANIICSIGAVFDFYAETIKRPSSFWINIHLEWLPRLIKEPKRLWKRNFISTPLFLFDVLLYKIKNMK